MREWGKSKQKQTIMRAKNVKNGTKPLAGLLFVVGVRVSKTPSSERNNQSWKNERTTNFTSSECLQLEFG
jgi:hypothetical protein